MGTFDDYADDVQWLSQLPHTFEPDMQRFVPAEFNAIQVFLPYGETRLWKRGMVIRYDSKYYTVADLCPSPSDPRLRRVTLKPSTVEEVMRKDRNR